MSDAPLTLLPDATRARLSGLLFTPRRPRQGGQKGERRSTQRGTSIEFADYRNYVAGDDLRKLDWNVYARLDRPTIKLYEDEEQLTVHILLDNSASMGAIDGTDAQKWQYAQQWGAQLGFVALNGGDQLFVHALAQSVTPYSGRSKAQTALMLNHIRAMTTHGRMDINQALKNIALREKRVGMVFIISDLFAPNGYHEGINALLAKGHEVTLIHTLTPQEIEPPLVGDLRLIDVETGNTQDVTIDVSLQTRYRQSLEAWLAGIRADCGKRGIHYVQVSTDNSPEQAILHDLRRAGVVR
jgi:uncharacterized protein (DUF58 family)